MFNTNDALIGLLADKIESAVPGRIQNVERIIRGADGRIKTDFILWKALF